MDQQREKFERNIISYFNCKKTSGILDSQWSYDGFEDVIILEKRIKVSMKIHTMRQRWDRRNFISMTIITMDDNKQEYPICGFSFDVDENGKELIEYNSFGCGHPEDWFEELKNIFNAWSSSMDEFIKKLQLLNISLV